MATKRKSQISGQAAGPTKLMQRRTPKSPWERVNRELVRLDKRIRKLNPF
jgi:uncharacterized protein (DUF2342 family)